MADIVIKVMKDTANLAEQVTQPDLKEKEKTDLNPSLRLITKFATDQALSYAKQGADMYINWIGDAQLANSVNIVSNLIGDATTLYVGGALGPVGLGVAIGAVASKYTMKAVQFNYNVELFKRQQNFDMQQTGELFNRGSRYGSGF